LKLELPDRVAEFMIRHDMAGQGMRLGIAVSGGADSIVMLHVLNRLAASFEFEPVIVHVNHGLRGAESEEDERWVRRLTSELDRTVHVFQAPIESGENLEQAARDKRRSIFRSLIESGSVSRVAVGHNQSDQAETILFRLVRGTGQTGLAGMRPVTADGLVRPLLTLGRYEIRSWAQEQGIVWREDSTNSIRTFRRNFIRHDVIPALQQSVNAAVEPALARMADIAQAEEDYWCDLTNGLMESLVKRSPHGYLCNIKSLILQPLAVQRRLLRAAIARVKGDLRSIDSSHIEAVLGICRSAAGHDRVLIPGIDALRSFETLRLCKPESTQNIKRHYCCPLIPDREISLPYNAGTIQINRALGLNANARNCAKFVNEKDRIEIVILNSEVLRRTTGIDQKLCVRNWEPGDAYQPAGQGSIKKVKQLFQDNRVPLWERRHWPVLDLGGDIVWVRGFGPSIQFQAEQDSLSTVSLTYVPACESNSWESTS
jgi:tRNA(Ile)-lysidine synthase